MAAQDSQADKLADKSFEQVAGRLEQIAEKLEGGEVELEDALELFAEGVQLAKEGQARLDAAEQRIEQLLASGEVVPLKGSD